MIRRFCSALLMVWPLAVTALAPDDFVSGIELAVEPGKPLLELTLPDAVYARLRRADLSDLRVFNAEGVAVPHALCAAAQAAGVPPELLPLRLFPLQAAARGPSEATTRIDVQTDGAVDLSVRPQETKTPARTATALAAYVIDARELKQGIQALHLDWHSPDGASTVQVRVEASTDLDRWTMLVAEATLLQAGASGQRLERDRIPLPPAEYTYLRLRRVDAGPQPELRSVSAELASKAAPQRFEWFEAASLPAEDGREELPTFLFDAWHLAPLTRARPLLPAGNMSVRVALYSRATMKDAWRNVWNGEVYTLDEAAGQRRSADPLFAENRDRYWRLQVLQGADSLREQALRLQLGYVPDRLRFLAQGQGPFLLAYGSERAGTSIAQDCDSLLAEIREPERGGLLGLAQPGSARTLGGAAALEPAPKELPLRLMLLWALLIGGALTLVLMAYSMLKRLKTPP